ncbi:hypothetical protein ACFODZ_06815 [Marinicella sediminis]|uniref:Kazal-like domain-containing protein n=1 Tax=Marinicella sediminis TaxID=1792834 RepID=A0ABV7JEV8_9GAMM|nr:hypothetical protein [Marinicella sediminis]
MKTCLLLIFCGLITACQPVNQHNESAQSQSETCANDLKTCENGQQVGRDPENQCAFYPCDGPDLESSQEPMMCTQEVKRCPDGSYVGRDPYNNCAFNACPEGDSDTH